MNTGERPTKKSLDEVLTAIDGSGGIKSHIAKKLGVTRVTLDGYLDKLVTARDAFEQEKQINLDLSESLIHGNIRAASNMQNTAIRLANQKGQDAKPDDWARAIVDTSDAKWILSRLGKGRGYSERTEITGMDGESLTIKVSLKDD